MKRNIVIYKRHYKTRRKIVNKCLFVIRKRQKLIRYTMDRIVPKYTYGLLQDSPENKINSDTCTSGSLTAVRDGRAYSASTSAEISSNKFSRAAHTTSNDHRSYSSSSLSTLPNQRRHSFTSSSKDTSSNQSKDTTPATPSTLGIRSSSARVTSSRSYNNTPTPSTPGQQLTESSVIIAIVEGRGLAKGEVGVASIDLKNPVLILSQFSDNQSYVKLRTKMNLLNPVEVILPLTIADGSIMSMAKEEFPNVTVSTVQRRYFNENKGLQYIRHICLPEYLTVELELVSKYYCLAAASALMKYVEFIQNTLYAASSLKVVFKGSEQTTMIDATTGKNLELISNLVNPRGEVSLYGAMSSVKTSSGARLLRANILQPPSHMQTIDTRLETVAEILDNEEVFYSLRSVLERFLDVEQLVSLAIQLPRQETVRTAENKITLVIYLRHTLQLVHPLREALQHTRSPLLHAYYQTRATRSSWRR